MSKLRKTASLSLERDIRSQGFTLVGGMDEAGRGPLAGPVCAAIVIFEPGVKITGVYDSKALDAEQREDMYSKIMSKALAVGVGLACAEEIDQINILRATRLAARRALRQMAVMPDFLLLDALILDKVTIPQMSITKGDSRSFSIAAASIVAKVTRDRLMEQCSDQFPEYGFENHKGYGTPTHRRFIEELGRCSLHRQTFLQSWFDVKPIRNSRLFDLLCEKLWLCSEKDQVHDILFQLQGHRNWFPVTEWNSLAALARRRCDEIEKV